jgi:hypothetical protein
MSYIPSDNYNNIFKNQIISSYSNTKKVKYWLVALDNRNGKNWYGHYPTIPFHLRYSHSNPIVLLRNYPNLYTNFQIVCFPVLWKKLIFNENVSKIKFISYPNKIIAIFGKYFNSGSNSVIVDLDEKSFTLCDGSKEYLPDLIYTLPLYFEKFNYSELFFFYIENTLIVQEFFPYYETIQYPFLNTIYYNILIDRFERYNVENKNVLNNFTLYFNKSTIQNCIDNGLIENFPPTIDLNRPKLAFSKDLQTWYKYDISQNQFVEIQNYSYSEHLNQGNTFLEYWTIPTEKWLEFLDNDKNKFVYFSVNNTITPILINPVYFEEMSNGDLIRIDERNNTAEITYMSY